MGRQSKRLGADAVRALRDYDWPGNVRELEHAIEHAMVLAQRDIISAQDLPFVRQSGVPREASTAPGLVPLSRRTDVEPLRPIAPVVDSASDPLAELAELPYADAKKRVLSNFDETYTRELLHRASGNMSEAARRAGLDRSNFRRLLKRCRDEV
jgi:DNA-binding NtrC family response regulator